MVVRDPENRGLMVAKRHTDLDGPSPLFFVHAAAVGKLTQRILHFTGFYTCSTERAHETDTKHNSEVQILGCCQNYNNFYLPNPNLDLTNN